MATYQERKKRGRPPKAPDPNQLFRGRREQALTVIFETATELGEGFRHGALGAPRAGKTYHVRAVMEAAIESELATWAFVHDTKRADAQYEGVIRESVEALNAAPIGEDDPPIVVFHQSPTCRPTVEEVADLGLRFGRAGQPVVVVADELYKGLKSRMTWDGVSMGEILREGSSQGVSAVWTTQIPQSLPTEALDLSETVAIFNLSGRSLSYAIDTFRLPDAAARVIPKLQRGEFILIHATKEWDRTVYGPE
jgi:hypothetical protein